MTDCDWCDGTLDGADTFCARCAGILTVKRITPLPERVITITNPVPPDSWVYRKFDYIDIRVPARNPPHCPLCGINQEVYGCFCIDRLAQNPPTTTAKDGKR
jgi:hypothetical protein